MFDTWPALVGAGFMVLVGLFVLLKGGEPERIGAGAYMMGWFASLLFQGEGGLFGVQWGMFALDVVMLMMKLPTPVSAFYTVVNMTGYGIMLAIAIGTFWAWQERRAIGAEAD